MRRRALQADFRKGGLYPAFFLLLTIFIFSIFQIKSYDLWWHLKAGEDIVGAGFKPAPTNTFSWTEPEQPWNNFSWLFDVIVYLIHKAAGFNGLIAFQAILVAAVFFVVYKTISFQSGNPPQSPFAKGGLSFFPSLEKRGQGRFIIIAALFLIAYFAARFRFSLRPHLLVLLFFAIDIYFLNRLSGIRGQGPGSPLSFWERVGVRVPLIAIPLLQILWANVHGSAIVGVLLPVLFLIGNILNPPQSPFNKGGRKGDFFLILLLTLAASLINPYGYTILTDPFTPFFGQGADLLNILAVDEWQMPDKDMLFGWYGLLLTIGIASFLPRFVETPRRGVSTDLLLFSTFTILSLKAVRFIDLFVVAAVPVIYRNLIQASQPGTVLILRLRSASSVNRDSPLHPSSLILYPLLILSLFWLIGIKDTTFSPGLGVDEEVVPKRAVDFLEKNRVGGKIFNSYNFGGYLIYKGYPVFIDGRLCYSPELVKDFADANLTDSGWKRVDEKYQPDVVLVEYDKPAIPEALLIDKKNWALVYWDDLDMLFLKRNDKFSAIIDRNEYRAVNPMDMYGLPVNPPESPFVKGGTKKSPPLEKGGEGGFERLKGRIFAEAQRRVKDGPESMRAHLLMGNLYMSRGEADKSIVEYEAVIKSFLSFGKAEAHNNLGTVYEGVGDVYSAEEEYKEAIRLDSVYPLPQRNLGYLKLGQYQNVEALWHLNKYIQLDGGDRKTLAIVSELKRYRDTFILRIFIGGGAVIGMLWIAARQFNRRGTVL